VSVSEKPGQTATPLAPIGIPPFPAIAIKALQLVSSGHAEFRELSDMLKADTALSSEILRVSNSALYGIPEVFESVARATVYLGLERTRNVILTVAMRRYFGKESGAAWVENCWRHSLGCALISEEIAQKTKRVEPDVAYTASLMHDMGRLAIAVAYPEEYGGFLTNSREQVTPAVLEREHEMFGVNHCEAGISLASFWSLPESLGEVMSHHHEQAAEGDSDLLSIVRLGCKAATALDFAVIRPIVPGTYDRLLKQLPDRDRGLLPKNPAELKDRIEKTILHLELK
jgi:putative nucleotidyltransferase with HDIG domain